METSGGDPHQDPSRLADLVTAAVDVLEEITFSLGDWLSNRIEHGM